MRMQISWLSPLSISKNYNLPPEIIILSLEMWLLGDNVKCWMDIIKCKCDILNLSISRSNRSILVSYQEWIESRWISQLWPLYNMIHLSVIVEWIHPYNFYSMIGIQITNITDLNSLLLMFTLFFICMLCDLVATFDLI